MYVITYTCPSRSHSVLAKRVSVHSDMLYRYGNTHDNKWSAAILHTIPGINPTQLFAQYVILLTKSVCLVHTMVDYVHLHMNVSTFSATAIHIDKWYEEKHLDIFC